VATHHFVVTSCRLKVAGFAVVRTSTFNFQPATFTPMWLSSDSSSFVNCRAHAPRECESLRRLHFEGRKRIEKSLRCSDVVRTTRERLLSAIFLRPFRSRGTIIRAPVAVCQHLRTRRLQVIPRLRDAGSTNHGHVVKPEQQRVQTQNLAALGVQVPSCPPSHGDWLQREKQTPAT
jgi:hypothetical protein